MKRHNSLDLHVVEDNDCVIIIKENLRMQIKTKMRNHYIAIGMAKIQNSNNECW